MENLKTNKMGAMPMFPLILSMSLPAMFSMLIQSLYNVVDSIFVAQLGENALTAVSLAYPIQMLMVSVAVGTGVGINSLVSRRLGERDQDAANKAATHGFFLAVFSSVAFALFGAIFSRPFIGAFTQDGEILQMGTSYLSIVTILSFGSFIVVNFEKTLQATGNMIYPMVFQLTGAIINIILDPIMIFGYLGCPAMGVAGAALATVIGQIASMALSVYVAFFKEHEVEITLRGFRFKGATIRDIYAVGLPAIVMQSIGSVLIMGLNGILAAFSGAAVSVLGVYYKLQSFVFMPVFGLTQGVMPIMGYNYGARNKRRMMDALRIGTIIAVVIMAVGTLIFMLLPVQLLEMFNASEEMMRVGVMALQTISWCFVPAALGILFSTLFRAVGCGARSLIISVLRQLVVILPVAYLLSRIGLEYVWWSFVIAEVVSLVASIVIFLDLYKKRIAHLADEPVVAPEGAS